MYYLVACYVVFLCIEKCFYNMASLVRRWQQVAMVYGRHPNIYCVDIYTLILLNFITLVTDKYTQG